MRVLKPFNAAKMAERYLLDAEWLGAEADTCRGKKGLARLLRKAYDRGDESVRQELRARGIRT